MVNKEDPSSESDVTISQVDFLSGALCKCAKEFSLPQAAHQNMEYLESFLPSDVIARQQHQD